MPFLAVAVVLGAATFVLPMAAGAVALGVATAALAIAAVQSLRSQWAAATHVPAPSTVALAAPGAVPADALTDRLHRLHELHAEKINLALDEGREGLAAELSDTYADEALRAITAAGLPASGQ
jgi:quinol-cytochrome oxidoreductase complex cytochrome b subunit